MPANEFEKQVQDRLDDFQLSPSASVWKNVEEQIRQRKRRRTIIFFLLPLTIAAISFLIWSNAGSFKQPADGITAENSNRTKIQQQEGPVEKENATRNGSDKNIDQPSNDAGGPAIPIAENNQPAIKQGGNHFSIQTGNAGKKRKAANIGTSTNNNPVTENNSLAAGNVEAGIQTEITDIVEDKSLQQQTEINAQDDSDVRPDSDQQDSVVSNVMPTNVDENEESQEKKQTPVVRNSRFRWGVHASVGVTSPRSSIFSLRGMSQMQDSYYGSPSTGSGSPSGAPRPPSDIRAGTAFSMGMAGEMMINERFSLQSGISYSFQSTRTRTGIKKDTAIDLSNIGNQDGVLANGIYVAGAEKNYTNQFHFIQLPLSVSWKVHRKIPLYMNVGGAASYLVKTNALMYSPALGGFYYHDKSAFRKMHYNLSTGLALQLNLKNGAALSFGPSLMMDMTPVADKAGEPKRYLMNAGFNFRYLLPQKK